MRARFCAGTMLPGVLIVTPETEEEQLLLRYWISAGDKGSRLLGPSPTIGDRGLESVTISWSMAQEAA
jgi:hypothetical protein